MLRAIQVSIGGIPLLYGGDEFGQMNDYTDSIVLKINPDKEFTDLMKQSYSLKFLENLWMCVVTSG